MRTGFIPPLFIEVSVPNTHTVVLQWGIDFVSYNLSISFWYCSDCLFIFNFHSILKFNISASLCNKGLKNWYLFSLLLYV